MSLRSKVIRLAYTKPELRPHLLPLLVKQGMEHATEDARKKYLQDHPKADPKNHTVSGGGEGGKKKDEGDGGGEAKPVAFSKAESKKIGDLLAGWNEPGAWGHVISYAIAGKEMEPKHVQKVVDEIDQWLGSWDAKAKSAGWGPQDKKDLTKAKKILEKGLGKSAPKPKADKKGPGKLAPGVSLGGGALNLKGFKSDSIPDLMGNASKLHDVIAKSDLSDDEKKEVKGKLDAAAAEWFGDGLKKDTFSAAWKLLQKLPKPSKAKKKLIIKPKAKKVMEKYDLTDDDADDVGAFKRTKPDTDNKMGDAALMALFLSKASPETKKRIMGPPKMSAADFKVMLAAISDDDEEGAGGDIKFGSSDLSVMWEQRAAKEKYPWDQCIKDKKADPKVDDPEALCAWIKNKSQGKAAAKAAIRRRMFRARRQPQRLAGFTNHLPSNLNSLVSQTGNKLDWELWNAFSFCVALLNNSRLRGAGSEVYRLLGRPEGLWPDHQKWMLKVDQQLGEDKALVFAFCVALLEDVNAHPEAAAVDRLLAKYL